MELDVPITWGVFLGDIRITPLSLCLPLGELTFDRDLKLHTLQGASLAMFDLLSFAIVIT